MLSTSLVRIKTFEEWDRWVEEVLKQPDLVKFFGGRERIDNRFPLLRNMVPYTRECDVRMKGHVILPRTLPALLSSDPSLIDSEFFSGSLNDCFLAVFFSDEMDSLGVNFKGKRIGLAPMKNELRKRYGYEDFWEGMAKESSSHVTGQLKNALFFLEAVSQANVTKDHIGDVDVVYAGSKMGDKSGIWLDDVSDLLPPPGRFCSKHQLCFGGSSDCEPVSIGSGNSNDNDKEKMLCEPQLKPKPWHRKKNTVDKDGWSVQGRRRDCEYRAELIIRAYDYFETGVTKNHGNKVWHIRDPCPIDVRSTVFVDDAQGNEGCVDWKPVSNFVSLKKRGAFCYLISESRSFVKYDFLRQNNFSQCLCIRCCAVSRVVSRLKGGYHEFLRFEAILSKYSRPCARNLQNRINNSGSQFLLDLQNGPTLMDARASDFVHINSLPIVKDARTGYCALTPDTGDMWEYLRKNRRRVKVLYDYEGSKKHTFERDPPWDTLVSDTIRTIGVSGFTEWVVLRDPQPMEGYERVKVFDCWYVWERRKMKSEDNDLCY